MSSLGGIRIRAITRGHLKHANQVSGLLRLTAIGVWDRKTGTGRKAQGSRQDILPCALCRAPYASLFQPITLFLCALSEQLEEGL
jgi:hypothetical protein